MLLSEIARLCGGTLLGTDADASVEASIDSRAVVTGGLFCALPGDRTDGHRFVAGALADGAAAALVTDPEAVEGGPVAGPLIVVDDVAHAMGRLAAAHVADLRAAGELTVLAVTGSAGKTSTKDLLGAALPGPTVVTERSLNNELGLPLTALRATPETRYLVVEMGADREGDLRYLTGLVAPDVAIVLMVGPAHLGNFGSIEDTTREKSDLVRGLLPGGTAILNADDARVTPMADITEGPVLWFGIDGTPPARAGGRSTGVIRAHDITLDERDRPSFTARYGEESCRVELGLSGAHHVRNALAALAGAIASGVPLGDAAERIRGLAPGSAHRMHVVDRDGVTVIDDAYNANPDSMAAALESLVRIAGPRRTVAVLGAMYELGDTGPAEHERVGRRAAELGVDLVISVGADAAGITSVVEPGRRLALTGLEEARTTLQSIVGPGDVVLFKASNGTGLWRLAEEWTA